MSNDDVSTVIRFDDGVSVTITKDGAKISADLGWNGQMNGSKNVVVNVSLDQPSLRNILQEIDRLGELDGKMRGAVRLDK